MTNIAAVSVAALLAVGIVVLTGCLTEGPEGFTLATDVCDSINTESRVYTGSPGLREICERADLINPDETCLVDCDVDSLCRNPSVGHCRKPRGPSALCDVTDNYYGSHPDNSGLPSVYRVRRGTCLVATAEGAFVDDANLRRALLRFPESLAIVGGALGHESRLHDSWTVTLAATPGASSEDVRLESSLASYDFVVESAERARGSGASHPVPTAVLHESCVSPGGEDTSFSTEPAPLQERLARASLHENQPPVLHVTMRFSLPDTARLQIGPTGPSGLIYTPATSGQTRQVKKSPVSGARLSVRTEVWLMLEVSPKDGVVREAREVLRGSDGRLHISRRKDLGPAAAAPMSFLSYQGQPPEMWWGMRDAARDVTAL